MRHAQRDFPNAKLGATAEWEGITGRLQQLEQRADLLGAKLEALRSLVERRSTAAEGSGARRSVGAEE